MKYPAVVLSLVLAIVPAYAQLAVHAKASPLFETIRDQDARLFDAYNRCDLKALAGMVSEDLEFYHDQTGLSRGRDAFLDAIKTNICGKVHRELVSGTLEAYPLKSYGAVEIGAHVFCSVRKISDCDPAKDGMAKFVMLWRQEGASWLLTRVISYDHVSAPARKPD